MSSEDYRSRKPSVVGIVGGVGSGKSAVARGLAEGWRVDVVDADQIGHEVLTLPEIRHRIHQTFGPGVFAGGEPTGGIDRHQLGRRVFGSGQQHRDSLTQLEAIVHPEIHRRIQSRISQHCESDRTGLEAVLLDAAVMFEAGWDDLCDAVVFIDAPVEVRLARVVKNRGWDDSRFREREASQLALDRKQELADFVVDNSGSLEDGIRQLREYVSSLTRQNSFLR